MSDYQIETRRRSRSKTPFLRSSCDHENCEYAGEEGHTHHHHHQNKKAPNVQRIVEETVEVSSSISPTKQTQKTKTSDYSSEDTSPESKSKKTTTTISEESSQKSKQMSSSSTNRTTTTTTSTTVITKGKRIAGSTGGAATSTPKTIKNYLLESFASQFTGGTGAESATQRYKEITQNALNTEFERSQRSAAAAGIVSNNSSINKSYSQILSNSNGDLSDHIAYLEYKRAGEYWNTTPKTDYTYSEHSPFRRELAPGVVAMPNMSRNGLKNHHERINYMIERDPAQEEFIRRRYESSRYAQNRRAAEKLAYESGDEVDQLDSYRKRQYQRYLQEQQESWYVRIITTIVTTITSVWTSLTGGDGGGGGGGALGYDNSALYRTKYGQVEKGFFGSITHAITSSISRLFRYIYLMISSVLCLDTWLLQSSNADGRGKKRFLLLLLILLPLLLLGGLYYYLHPKESFPPRHFSEMTFTLPTLPDVSEYFNEDKYVALKEQTYNRLEDFRTWTDDYVMYLRTVSNNILDEGRKLFQREEFFERA